MTFYATVITVEVISEEPYNPDTLADVHYDVTEGGCSGVWKITGRSTLTREQVKEALIAQGSDPEFLLGDDDDYEHDGQPDEAQEWRDFDPDC
jgi:hypothetical protein